MKAVVVHSPGNIRWEDVKDPAVPGGWVNVAVKAVGICSTDVPRALSGSAYHYPIVLGHEIAGIVHEVGPDVDIGLVGTRVAVAPLIPCRACRWCRVHRYSLCDDYDYLGSRRDGGCAELVAAPAPNLIELPAHLPYESGALLEPAAVALHGLLGMVEPGDTVAVIGMGTIGLFAIQIAMALGARPVLALDTIGPRLRLAEELGAMPLPGSKGAERLASVVNRENQASADLVAVCAGTAAAQLEALRLVRKGGRILLLGLPKDAVLITPEQFSRIVRHEVQISGSWNSYSSPFPGAEWQTCRSYMASGQLRPQTLITNRFPMSQAERAYRLLAEDPASAVKVILTL